MAKKMVKQSQDEIEARKTSGTSEDGPAENADSAGISAIEEPAKSSQETNPGAGTSPEAGDAPESDQESAGEEDAQDAAGPGIGDTTQEGHEETDPPVETVPLVEEAAPVPTGPLEQPSLAAGAVPEVPITSERRHLVRSAALVSIGNLGSSLMGMVRQIAVTSLGTPISTPFNAAMTPMTNFFQLLINGSVSGALVPTFNDYAAPEKRQELRRLVFTMVNLVLLIALVSAIGYALIAPWFINILVSGYPANEKLLTLQYSQIIFFSLAALGPFAVLMAALFALKEFGWPAFATAAQHAGIILGVIVVSYLSSFYLGLMALPFGVLLGSLGEIALLIPGMRKQHLSYMFVLDLRHPALRRILRLYFPIAVSFVFTTLLVFLDLHLQSLTPGNRVDNTTAMATATTLIQFPVGLVAMALSFAVLPTLTEHARAENNERFKATLLLGFRVGLLLMIPAMVGLIILRIPIATLIFAHRNYHASNAGLTALALQNYAYQLPFVAIDQLLIAAFYARKNTKTPVIIGIVSILFYLIVALPFYSTIGMPALAFANTVQNSSHAIILFILLRRAMGSLHIRTTIPAILKICAAAALMGLVAWGALALLSHLALFSLDHLSGQLLTVIVAGGLSAGVYFGAIALLKVEEINLVKSAILAKLGKR
jgi:putative peptidoglycan lipid II flippase